MVYNLHLALIVVMLGLISVQLGFINTTLRKIVDKL